MSDEYHSTGYDYGQGPRSQPPRPAPPPPKCETSVCKDGGSAPFYTLYEKDGHGWRTGRSMVICHTCYYGGVQPQFRGDAIPMPVVPGSLHVTGTEQDAVTLKQQQQAMHGHLPVQEDASQRALQAQTGQTSYSGQQMKTIIIESPTNVKAEVTSSHDERMNVTHVEKPESTIEIIEGHKEETGLIGQVDLVEVQKETKKRRTTRGSKNS